MVDFPRQGPDASPSSIDVDARPGFEDVGCQSECCADEDCSNGLVCEDGTCACTLTELSCGDGHDNDCDGQVDCLDSDCQSDLVACPPAVAGCADSMPCDATTACDAICDLDGATKICRSLSGGSYQWVTEATLDAACEVLEHECSSTVECDGLLDTCKDHLDTTATGGWASGSCQCNDGVCSTSQESSVSCADDCGPPSCDDTTSCETTISIGGVDHVCRRVDGAPWTWVSITDLALACDEASEECTTTTECNGETFTCSDSDASAPADRWTEGTCPYTFAWSTTSWDVCTADAVWATGDWSACDAEATWSTDSWSSCDAECGGGTQSRSVTCDADAGSQSRSVSCAPVVGTQSRGVTCRRSDGAVVADSFCAGAGSKPDAVQGCTDTTCEASMPSAAQSCSDTTCDAPVPAASQACNTQACYSYSWLASSWGSCDAEAAWSTGGWGSCSAEATWSTGDWGTCSAECGGGTQSRSVSCNAATGVQSRTVTCNPDTGSQSRTVGCQRSDGAIVDDSFCADAGSKPAAVQSCSDTTCDAAMPSSTTSCSDTTCDAAMPSTSQTCNTQTCYSYAWNTSSWGACSAEAVWATGGWGSCSAEATWSTGGWGSCSAEATWSAGSWGSCSAECGGGTQARSVTCNAAAGTQSRSVTCNAAAGSQSRSVSCAPVVGTQNRTVWCERNDGAVVADGFCSGSKPVVLQGCTDTTCEGSAPSSTTSCSDTTCDAAMPSSVTSCFDSTCDAAAPATTQTCNTQTCASCSAASYGPAGAVCSGGPTAHGGTAGSCSEAGSCSATCNNGSWQLNEYSCEPYPEPTTYWQQHVDSGSSGLVVGGCAAFEQSYTYMAQCPSGPPATCSAGETCMQQYSCSESGSVFYFGVVWWSCEQN